MANNFLFVQAPKFKLAGSGCTSSASSIIVESMLLPDGGTAIEMTDFGSIGFGTLEPGTSREEQISFTGITQNGDGTATLTGVTRGVRFVSPYDAVSANQYSHGGGSIFVVSNTAGFYDKLTAQDDDETVTGLWTFTQNPKKSGVLIPTLDAEYASKKYVDQTATGTTNVQSILVTGTANGSVTIGLIVYELDSSNGVNSGKWALADSSTSTPLGKRLGVCQTTATSGQAINVLTAGKDTNQSGLSSSKGTSYFLSTAGTISTTPGTFSIFVGRNDSTDSLIFDPISNVDVQLISGGTNYVTSTGSANAYVVTYVPAIKAYQAGLEICFKANFGCTGATTVNVNGLGAVAMKKGDGATATATGDIASGQVMKLKHDGTNFQILNPTANTVSLTSSAYPTGDGTAITGVLHSTVISQFTTDVSFASSTSENTLMTTSLAGNILGTTGGVKGKIITSTATNQFQISNTKTCTIRLKYGGTTLATAVITNASGGAIDGVATIEFHVFASGATNTQKGLLYITVADPIGEIASASHLWFTPAVGTSAVDSTASQTLAVTCQFNNSSVNDAITAGIGYIERF